MAIHRSPHTALRRVVGRLVAGAAVTALAACGSSEVPDGAPEGPVSDAELLAHIREIDHVSAASLTYQAPAYQTGPSYRALVAVDAEVDMACVTDQVYAILWMGRHTWAHVTVQRSSEPASTLVALPYHPARAWTESDLAERYGPRPEPGSHPTPAAAPACG